MIIAIILGFIPLGIIYYIFNYEPDISLPFKNIKLFGNLFGTIVNIVIIWFTFFIILILFSNLITFIFSQYLNKTPTIIISIVFMITIIYVLVHGLKTITRTAMMLFFISIILYLLSLIGLFNQLSIDNFKPFLENSYQVLFRGSYSYITYNIFPLYLFLIIPKNDISDKSFFKYVSIFYIVACFSLLIVLITTLGIFGIKMCYLYEYPEFQVLKYVSLVGMSARIDGILIIQWIFDLIIFMIMGMYFIKECTISLFNVNKHIFSIIIGILLIILNEYFSSNMLINDLSINIIPNIMFISISLYFVIMFISIKIKNYTQKKNR